jgi:hypothetical protein
MANPGYIYVLANSSMPDLVKVGKSQRPASERATELSRVTGVPTPFIVVYEQLFADQDGAESFVHAMLSQKGLRQTDNREFFRASAKDVIEVILTIAGKNDQFGANTTETAVRPERDDLDDLTISHPWSDVWDQAEDSYFGRNNSLQDRAEAMKLYLDAVRLGCPLAYERIGKMYRYGITVPISDSRALDWYKRGARAGNYLCYLQMAELFLENGHLDNHRKCFKLYMQSRREIENWVVESDQPIADALAEYVVSCLRSGTAPFDDSVLDLKPYREQIVSSLNQTLELYRERPVNDPRKASRIRQWYLSALQWTTNHL